MLARAEEALAARNRLRAHRGEEGEEEEQGIGPVSNDPVAEARRFVERKLMGAGGGNPASRPLSSLSSLSSSTRVLTGAPADRRRAMMAARSGRRRFVATEEEEEGPPEALI